MKRSRHWDIQGSQPETASPVAVGGLGQRCAAWLLLGCLLVAGCARQPTMRLNHADVTGISVGFPPRVGVQMRLYVDVYNPNSYDVAIRAVRGQVLLAGRHALPIDYRPPGEGVWLSADTTTQVVVPVEIPVEVALGVLAESWSAPLIGYHFSGRADVTATRSLRLERDDYSVEADGVISRAQIRAALGLPG